MGPSQLRLAQLSSGQHPNCHTDHEQVLGQRHETERDSGCPTDTGAFKFTPVDIDRLDNRHRAYPANEECDRYRYP